MANKILPQDMSVNIPNKYAIFIKEIAELEKISIEEVLINAIHEYMENYDR